jgi:hypothetical protein
VPFSVLPKRRIRRIPSGFQRGILLQIGPGFGKNIPVFETLQPTVPDQAEFAQDLQILHRFPARDFWENGLPSPVNEMD